VHAALIAYHGGQAYLLDIEIAEVTDHRNVARYVPIFSISETGWWSYQALSPTEAAKGVGQVANVAPDKIGPDKIEADRIGPNKIGTEKAAPQRVVPEWRSLHLRHKPSRPPSLATRHRPGERALAWRWPHLKHKPVVAATSVAQGIAKPGPRPVRHEPAVAAMRAREPTPARAPAREPDSTPTPEPEHVAEPGERIEEMFLPGAN